MAEFTSTISESVILNGAVRGSTQNVTISEIYNVAEKIMECPSGLKGDIGVTVIGNWASVTNPNHVMYQSYDFNDSKYVRVTNLDELQECEVAYVSNGLENQCEAPKQPTDSCRFRLGPLESSIMWVTEKGKMGNCDEPKWTQGLTDLSYIVIMNPSLGEEAKPINVELFVAGGKPVVVEETPIEGE